MFCKNCGTKIPDDSAFCPNCGSQVSTPVVNNDERKNDFLDPEFQNPAEAKENLSQGDASTTPVLETVTEIPAADDAPVAPVEETIAETPAVDATSATPVLETVTETPATDVVSATPAQETVAATPAVDSVTATQATETQRAPIPQAPPKKGKTALILGIAGGGIVLILIIAGIIAFMATRNHNEEPFSNIDQYEYEEEQTTPDEVVPEDAVNTVGNTFANIGCGGIAAMQGEDIYYMQADSSGYNGMIVSMDMANTNEIDLYHFSGDIYYLNVIGDKIYFDGDVFDESDNLVSSNIYCYNIDTDTLDTIYPSTGYIYNLIVTGNKMYYSVENMDTELCDIYSANVDGSNPDWLISIDQYDNSFVIEDNSIYYVNGESLYRCDMNGENSTLIYTSSDTLEMFCIENSKIYIDEYNSAGYPVITAINMDGSNATTIIQSASNNWIDDLNIDNGVLYYIDSTYNDDWSEITSASLCSVQINGSNQKTLASVSGEIYGTGVCGDWLFYYDSTQLKTIKLQK